MIVKDDSIKKEENQPSLSQVVVQLQWLAPAGLGERSKISVKGKVLDIKPILPQREQASLEITLSWAIAATRCLLVPGTRTRDPNSR